MYNLEKEKLLVIDTETNGLYHPTEIHLICTLDGLGNTREFTDFSEKGKQEFYDYVKNYETIGGHHVIQYDLLHVLDRLLPDHGIPFSSILDTLVVSRLLRYDIQGGHSIRAWGERAGIKKEGQEIEQWSKLTPDMIKRCHSDCKISMFIIEKYKKYLEDERFQKALIVEHETARTCGEMTENGFPFDIRAAEDLHRRLKILVDPIDAALQKAFPPRPKLVREVTPRVTTKGAFNMNDFRWYDGDDLSPFSEGAPFSVIEYVPFNPQSPKMVVEILNEAGWKPTEKTKGHISALRERPRNKEKVLMYERIGWKVSEENLATLPPEAPAAAFDIAKRVVLSSRLSDIEEWIALSSIEDDHHVVHGSFNPIGAWTHRLSHSKPNLANVPVAKHEKDETAFQKMVHDFNDEMRGLWIPRPGYRLIGTDADGVQMRIFAHIVQDEELINALVQGSKEDGTDIHTLHQRKLGQPCKSRDSAKTFIYAWLLGAGNNKVAEILGTTAGLAKSAVENFIDSYPLLSALKKNQIPRDAARGYFEGLDGRLVICDSEHKMLAGYLQNGEAVIMKGACSDWQREAKRAGIPYWIRTWPHDEWQTETVDDDDVCRELQRIQIQSIRDQAVHLGLNCPLDGSSSWGYTWKETH